MNLAIASPSSSAYPETFIHMQMERLPCVLRIHGGPVASETIPGGAIAPLSSARGLLETAWSFGIKRGKWEGPQTAELVRRLRITKPDGLLANYGPTGVALLPACQKASIPLIVHFHGYDAHSRKVKEKHRENYRMLGIQAAAIIAVSHGMVESLAEMGIPNQKIHLIRYGVYPERFKQSDANSPQTVRFFGVGRFTDKKAPYLTLLAFSQARKQLPGAKLVLAGTGELMEATRNIACALRLGNSVEFPGILKPDEVAHEMRIATAFVQHSLEPMYGTHTGDREGTPVAILEAMITGLPVISTRHAGIGEVVEHERTGLLVEERDVAGMAAAMVTLATSPGLARKYGDLAREQAVSHFTADHYITALRQVIAEAL